MLLNSKSKFHKEMFHVCIIPKDKYSRIQDGKVVRISCLTAINVCRYSISSNKRRLIGEYMLKEVGHPAVSAVGLFSMSDRTSTLKHKHRV